MSDNSVYRMEIMENGESLYHLDPAHLPRNLQRYSKGRSGAGGRQKILADNLMVIGRSLAVCGPAGRRAECRASIAVSCDPVVVE